MNDVIAKFQKELDIARNQNHELQQKIKDYDKMKAELEGLKKEMARIQEERKRELIKAREDGREHSLDEIKELKSELLNLNYICSGLKDDLQKKTQEYEENLQETLRLVNERQAIIDELRKPPKTYKTDRIRKSQR